MKTRIFALLAVLSVLAILAIALPAAPTHASTDREVTIQGTVLSMPANGTMYGVYKIGTYKVRANLGTHFDQTDGKLKVGATVSVDGRFLSNGSIRAKSIDVLP